MADLTIDKDGAHALLWIGAGIGSVFLLFRFYCRWKFKRMAQ